MPNSPNPTNRDPVEQEQFLTILSREDALARFEAALFPRATLSEARSLADALGHALAQDIVATIDVPPFDRSNVDGFAVRSADLAAASEATPVRVLLNDEIIACGTAPLRSVLSGTATSIATGGPVPRGADAIIMVEHTQPTGNAIAIRRATSPGQFISYAGSDIARGETLLRAGSMIGSREIGMLAGCGIAEVLVARRPRVAVISTGNELVQPGLPLRPAEIYDSNGAIVTAAVSENGGEAVFLGAVADDEEALEAVMRKALENCDMLVLSGGTSKGAGDVSHRIIARLGKPGVIAHGVALKPGKPLCLAVCDGKPVVILPGFPTSAMFTFHDMIVPVLRRIAGLPPRADAQVTAKVPVRIASELGRTEFVMVSLVDGADGGLIAYPTGKGSGAITSFAQADGFLRVDALADQMPAGTKTEVTLFTPHVRVPNLVIVGSHCTGLDLVTAPLAQAGFSVRSIAVGSLGGLSAARRGECDLAPIHLFDEKTESYNTPFLDQGLELVPGWRRMQGIVFRSGDKRFEGLNAEDAVRAALADPACIMVNRNQGAGTRILIDRLLGEARPDGYWNQPRSHNAVAAAVAQHRADWGMTIAPVAHAAGLGFIPLAEEHYDFALVSARKQRPAVQAFLASLASEESRKALERAGFRVV
jgi:molybdenum cofactor synthesis domain-containing protein